MAIDLRYSAAQTPFAKWAEDHGMRAVNGLDLLLGQGVKAFEIFTGETAPLPTMRDAVQEARSKRHEA
jgi:shikimate dehydrogenase